MPMNARLLRPRATAALVAVDADARAYINAVRIADGGQYMEPAVQLAIDAFVVGCKADGIWSAIKASCILMGARTLSGALTPLVGAAPTNTNFVGGDYNRKTGLKGDGSTKSLNSNRNNNVDPQNSRHASVYVTEAPTSTNFPSYINTAAFNMTAAGGNVTNAPFVFRIQANHTLQPSGTNYSTFTGFLGINRSSDQDWNWRLGASSASGADASVTRANANYVFWNATNNARMSFYSIGEAIDLSLLRSRLDSLYTAIGAAIP